MATLKEKRATVQKSLLLRRQKLVKQGLCRDCGLNPIAEKRGKKRKPTLCEDCRRVRRTREANRRERLAGEVAS